MSDQNQNLVVDIFNNMDIEGIEPATGRYFPPSMNGAILQIDGPPIINAEAMNLRDGTKKPGICFSYTVVEGDNAGETFRDDYFIVDNSVPPSDGAKKAREGSIARFLGKLTVLLGREIPNGTQGSAIQEASALSYPIQIQANVRVAKDKKGYQHCDVTFLKLLS